MVLYTWLANRSGAPVLIVMLAHAAQGGLGGAEVGPMFSGADAELETTLRTAIRCAVAIAVAALASLRLREIAQPQGTAATTTAVPAHS